MISEQQRFVYFEGQFPNSIDRSYKTTILFIIKPEKMEKLQFEFMAKPSSDGKSNVMTITSITTADNRSFAIPEELQHISLHKDVMKTTVYNMVKNSLKKRHQFRRVWIELTEELKEKYTDDYDNMIFSDQILEEIIERPTAANPDAKEINTLNKILEKLMENTQKTQHQSLKKISEKFVIEKFTSKNSNANQWIDMFEKECTRFDVTEDEKKLKSSDYSWTNLAHIGTVL